MRVVTQKEMKQIEAVSAEKYHFTESLVIENVGVKGAEFIKQHLFKEQPQSIEVVFLIGKGNNGADGLAIARYLKQMGVELRAFVLFPEEETSPEVKLEVRRAKAFGVKVNHLTSLEQVESYFNHGSSNPIIVDAIFGTGVRLPLSNFIYDVLNLVNTIASYTIAVDIPSGVEGDTGRSQGNAIKADLTLCIALPKVGYYQADGAKLVGQIQILEVGFPNQELQRGGDKFLLDFPYLVNKLNPRNKFADKKTFGHTLVIGGSHGLTGALILASQAALKVGAGLVTGVTWEAQYPEFLSRLIPEIMTGYIPQDQAKWLRLIKNLNNTYDAIVIGPGLGRSARSRRIVLEIMSNYNGPLVLDADAINVLNLKEDMEIFKMRGAPTVMTPHFGEFSRFSGIAMDDLIKSPMHYLNMLVENINCTVVLKGPCTFLGSPSGKTFINFFPNDGMATGGSGDVLAGILGGLLGQDGSLKEKNSLYNVYESFDQIVGLSVLLHSISGQQAAKEIGVRSMSAMSLIEKLPQTFHVIDEKMQDHFSN
jgi:ADP-dependent NAD(P)H-hydrate dehydratase / NAD(P)H-hydrate epimerase